MTNTNTNTNTILEAARNAAAIYADEFGTDPISGDWDSEAFANDFPNGTADEFEIYRAELRSQLDSKPNAAHEIAELFGNDGSRMALDSGISIDDVCRERCVSLETRDGYGTRPVRYDFADGSEIVVHDDAWDYQNHYCLCGFCFGTSFGECRCR